MDADNCDAPAEIGIAHSAGASPLSAGAAPMSPIEIGARDMAAGSNMGVTS